MTYYRYKIQGEKELKNGTVPIPSTKDINPEAMRFIAQEISDREKGVVSVNTIDGGCRCAYPHGISYMNVEELPIVQFEILQFSVEGNRWYDLDFKV